MSPTTAKYLLYAFAALSVPVTVYPIWITTYLYQAITHGDTQINFTTSDYYFCVASIFWPMAMIEYLGQRTKKDDNKKPHWLIKHAGGVIMSWFFTCLTIGLAGGWAVPKILEKNSYHSCPNPDSISRTGPGQSLIFSLTPCYSDTVTVTGTRGDDITGTGMLQLFSYQP